MKKFIKEKYADIILQICTDYKNKKPYDNSRLSCAVDRALETLDKYSNYILGMGYMLHVKDIPYLKEYIKDLKGQGARFSDFVIEDLIEYLSSLE